MIPPECGDTGFLDLCQVVSIQLHHAAGRLVQCRQNVQQRGFSGAGRPHDDEHFALVDGQVDVFQYVEVAEVLFHVSQFDERSSCGFIARYQRHHGEYCFLFF